MNNEKQKRNQYLISTGFLLRFYCFQQFQQDVVHIQYHFPDRDDYYHCRHQDRSAGDSCRGMFPPRAQLRRRTADQRYGNRSYFREPVFLCELRNCKFPVDPGRIYRTISGRRCLHGNRVLCSYLLLLYPIRHHSDSVRGDYEKKTSMKERIRQTVL